MVSLTLADVVELLEQRYPPNSAASWDAVGLVAGDPAAPVQRIVFAVDPAVAVAREALAAGADLLITHHPLYLSGTTTVAATTAKGQVVHELITGGCGLYTAHTNADAAAGGVSEALADLLDLTDTRPIDPAANRGLDSWTTYVPSQAATSVIDAMAEAGAGQVGDYERCAYTSSGQGTFLPRHGATPTIGQVNEQALTPEDRIEMVAPPELREAVLAALRRAHPYEEPAFTLVEQETAGSTTGLGRIGRLQQPTTLRRLAHHVTRVLPATAQGIRVSGDLEAEVATVAVCGGAGDSLLATVRRLGADAYLTADLRHHPASESREEGRPYLLDATHWASEWPWLPVAARHLRDDAHARGAELDITVSTLVTDPWTMSIGGSDDPPPTPAEGAAT